MNADAKSLEDTGLEYLGQPALRTGELARVSESLHARERLLVASARASRLLLEAPDLRAAIPDVLALLGEAAHVDSVKVMESRRGDEGQPQLVVTAAWSAPGVNSPMSVGTTICMAEDSCTPVFQELRAGRSVCFSKVDVCPEALAPLGVVHGAHALTKAIVPIFLAGEFIGVLGFDNARQERPIDASELAALETAAGVIGAALHRERLVDDVRRERERAAEERAAELARANAVIRANLERLAGQTDLHSFMGHMLLEATRQFDAISGAVIVLKESTQEWAIVAHARGGELATPFMPRTIPVAGSVFTQRIAALNAPVHLEIASDSDEIWPGLLAFQRRSGALSTVLYPLIFGGQNIGFLAMSFTRLATDVQRSELLVALAQQATLAVQLTRVAAAAKEAAVLMERARIGQEIHDGLAQAFTGILMQLGAAEEFPLCKKRDSALSLILSRVRGLARDGLADARRSVMALRLDQTRRKGLELALRQLAERSTVPGGVTCTFEGGGISTGLRPEHEHELLRIAQEAVSNAVRHAHPHTVRISMLTEDAHWEMSVADDGVGMEQRPEQYAREGFGLSSMRQRAGAIGGEWSIESQPGHGTRVSVRILKQAA
ncbi:MAG: GAF domain-containing sensor histidine kinase [Proteobacteria bacterium]|nr:GAF domain-containing sensor histidine kinase [Pseudomonadota bacterium]